MIGRIQSVDVLRGLTVIAMILCASIGYNSDLPAWMFHCQVPPPDYVFKPEVRGITWVDMVFPLFIFSMGAAFPFALRRKIERGESFLRISLSIIKRWAVLVAFALVLGNADAASASSSGDVTVSLWRLGIWLALFAALVKTDRKFINLSGWIAILILLGIEQWVLDVPLSIHNNDCIILLLSTVALLGSFIWLGTRDSIHLRILVWLLAIVTKLVGWDFAMYLVIALPASIVGDVLMMGRTDRISGTRRTTASAWVALSAVLIQLWGLFTRQVALDIVFTFAFAVAFVLLTLRSNSSFRQIGWMGFVLLLAGIAFDPLDGGIAKDYCNMSYLLTTCGQASLVLCFIMWIESRHTLSRMISMTGQNPMIAYTVAWYVICPLLYALGLMGWIDDICVGSPLLGLCRGLLATSLMVACTCVFTRFKLFWRS